MTLSSKIVYAISLLFFMLFVYTAADKFMSYRTFQWDLSRDPIIHPFSKVLAIGVPIVEVIIAGMLVLPKLNKIGLWASFVIMALFTGYVWYVLKNENETRHCTCGGFIRELSWRQHLALNIGLTLLAGFALMIKKWGDAILARRNNLTKSLG